MESDIDIILLGDRSDSRIAQSIIKSLNGEFKTVYCQAESLFISKQLTNKRTVRLYECESVLADSLSGAVIIAKKTADLKSIASQRINPSAVIVSSENERHIKQLQSSGAAVITCGMSQKDTVTLSSSEGESYIVSLQRGFKIGGKTIEPQEVSLCANEKSSYSILAAGAAVILIKDGF